jgi:hypothetical protein
MFPNSTLQPSRHVELHTNLGSSWLHPRNYFDYIHSRHTVMAIKDWPKLMRRALECVFLLLSPLPKRDRDLPILS